LDLSAPHIAFVIASYIVSGAAIVSLIVATVARLKATERKLAELGRLGKTRGTADDEQ
jgi:hypothetical protein